jgi:hypothetical protein
MTGDPFYLPNPSGDAAWNPAGPDGRLVDLDASSLMGRKVTIGELAGTEMARPLAGYAGARAPRSRHTCGQAASSAPSRYHRRYGCRCHHRLPQPRRSGNLMTHAAQARRGLPQGQLQQARSLRPAVMTRPAIIARQARAALQHRSAGSTPTPWAGASASA